MHCGPAERMVTVGFLLAAVNYLLMGPSWPLQGHVGTSGSCVLMWIGLPLLGFGLCGNFVPLMNGFLSAGARLAEKNGASDEGAYLGIPAERDVAG